MAGDARVALHEYEFDMSKVTNIQSALTKLVEKKATTCIEQQDAYRSYLLAYKSHAHKDIFDVHSLDLQAVSESFGGGRAAARRPEPEPPRR